MLTSVDMARVHTPIDLGLAIRERRKQLRLDQQALATRAGVSRQWIIAIEHGKPRAEIGLILRVLRELDLQLDVTVADASRVAKRGRAATSDDLDSIVDKFRSQRR
jgi:HTH-type transcriptional regulator/antitoxin HipB